MYLPRQKERDVIRSLDINPVTAILGPRQCGKSTLARHILAGRTDTLYLDLERPSDLARLSDPEWFLQSQRGKLVCIDEIQRRPDLFPLIRSLVDEWSGNGHFLVLGSSSPHLMRQSSESLAGRIAYIHLEPFLFTETAGRSSLEEYLARGGFPRSILAKDAHASLDWRNDFITTYLERDLLQYSGMNAAVMRRLWQMLAYANGQAINFSSLGNSLGISNVTVRNYLDLLQHTFMVEILPPFQSNLKKRLIKSPRVYVADSGITAALLGLASFAELSGHPALGGIWEQFVLLHLQSLLPRASFSWYRTSGGAELDLVITLNGKTQAVECKASSAPSLSRGNHQAIDDLNPFATWVVAPVTTGWDLRPGIRVIGPKELNRIADLF